MSEEKKPTIAAKAPIGVELEAGKPYFWCSCGESKNQPFCDGSHKGGSFVPQKVEVTESKTYYMCACKATGGAPFCDGSHKQL